VKNLFIAVLVGLPLVGCTEEVIRRQVPAAAGPEATPTPEQSTEGTEPPPGETPDAGNPNPGPTGPVTSPDKCLDGQDMDGADVDISTCPAVPEAPEDALMGKAKINMGAWEIGETSDGETYKYGTLSTPTSGPRMLEYSGGSSPVNAENLTCWAKGYYRLRKILQNPPAEYVALHKEGFQFRFFQFQTDLRNGTTGYKGIASFQDHLVKWVTIVNEDGTCTQPTLAKFKAYSKAELTRRGLPQPTN